MLTTRAGTRAGAHLAGRYTDAAGELIATNERTQVEVVEDGWTAVAPAPAEVSPA